MRKRFAAAVLAVGLMGMLGCAGAAAEPVLRTTYGINDNTGYPLYLREHPGARVEIEYGLYLYADIAERLMGRDAWIDFFRIRTDMGLLQHLRRQGFYEDLADSAAIRAFTDGLAPVFREQLTAGDQVVGVPGFLMLDYPMTLNLAVMEELGLTRAELPRTILELLAFARDWEADYGDEFPEIQAFSASYASTYALGEFNPYIGFVLEVYKDTQVARGEQLRFDTPLFYELLELVRPFTVDPNTNNAWREEPDQEHTLFRAEQLMDSQMFASLFGDRFTCWVLPLEAGAPPVVGYTLECVVVNPASEHLEASREVAACYARDCPPELLRALCPGVRTPYQRPEYDQDVAYLTEAIALERAALEDAPPEERRDRAFFIGLLEDALQDNLDHPYAISGEAMEAYWTQFAPYLTPRGEGIYESEQVWAETMSFAKRWLQGELDDAGFAKGMDAFLRMVELEGV